MRSLASNGNSAAVGILCDRVHLVNSLVSRRLALPTFLVSGASVQASAKIVRKRPAEKMARSVDLCRGHRISGNLLPTLCLLVRRWLALL